MTIPLLAHRGWWNTERTQNSREALSAATAAGFGIETDVRDALGTLVISHDPPNELDLTLEEAINHFLPGDGIMAINIKADGISAQTAELMKPLDGRWFAFDMSIPETVRYAAQGIPFYTRHSDVEPDPLFLDQAKGIWLDAFYDLWYDLSVIERHLEAGRKVAIVSPELHKRDPRPAVDLLFDFADKAAGEVLICTDLPELWGHTEPS